MPIINKAQQMGFETIAVSAPGDYPGFSAADKSYPIDVRKKDEILVVAKEERICGILTDQTDIPVPTVAYVAEHLGLAGVGYDCALSFTDKYRMRRQCQNVGIPVPEFFRATSNEEASDQAKRLGFPLIVKPVDNQGSRGISKVNQPNELEEKLDNAFFFSATGAVILEEVFEGHEVVVQGFCCHSGFFNLVIGDRHYFDLPDLFIPKQTVFPSVLKYDLAQKVFAMNAHLVKSLAPKFGITHSEYLVNTKTGEIILVEAAIRGGGVFISSDLVPLTCGIDINALLIRLATGNHIKIERHQIPREPKAASAYVCFYLPEGVISRVEGLDDVMSLPGVYRTHLDEIKIGGKTKPITDKTMRLGPILVSGKNRLACEQTIRNIQRTLFIDVETPQGIRGIVW